MLHKRSGSRGTVTAKVPGASNRGAKQRRFPRSMRLLRHADFERVYKLGRRHFSATLTAFYVSHEQEAASSKTAAASNAPTAGLRVGFTVGRALGGAVQRNRVKRRLREAVRLAPPPRELNADVVINPKRSLLAANFEGLLNEVRRAFVAIEEKLSNESKSMVDRRDSGIGKPED